MTLPKMTPEQLEEMQKKARASRQAQSKAIESVKKGGFAKFSALINTDDKSLKKIKVKRLVLSVPGVGAKGFELLCEEHGIDQGRRIGGLGSRQKDALEAWAKDYYASK